MTDLEQPTERRPLITHGHRKRSLVTWIVPLLVIVAIMIFLPKIVALLAE